MALFGGHSKPLDRFGEILIDTHSEAIKLGQPVLGFTLSLFGRLQIPLQRLSMVSKNTTPLEYILPLRWLLNR